MKQWSNEEEKATYQRIKKYVKDKYGVNVHTNIFICIANS